jgi:hypothetical protein
MHDNVHTTSLGNFRNLDQHVCVLSPVNGDRDTTLDAVLQRVKNLSINFWRQSFENCTALGSMRFTKGIEQVRSFYGVPDRGGTVHRFGDHDSLVTLGVREDHFKNRSPNHENGHTANDTAIGM